MAISVERKRQLVEPEHPRVSWRRPCALLGLARGNLSDQPVSEHAEHLQLMRLLDEQYTATPFYGVRRMMAWLHRRGYTVNPKRFRRLLRQMGLAMIDAKPRLSLPAVGHVIYPYLWRGVPVARVNQVWRADITAIRLQAGFGYLMEDARHGLAGYVAFDHVERRHQALGYRTPAEVDGRGEMREEPVQLAKGKIQVAVPKRTYFARKMVLTMGSTSLFHVLLLRQSQMFY